MNSQRGQVEIRHLNGVSIGPALHGSQLVSTCRGQQNDVRASWGEEGGGGGVLNLPLCAHIVGRKWLLLRRNLMTFFLLSS